MHKLFAFNPGHEEALRVSLQKNYTPSKEVIKLRNDLASLMTFFMHESDYYWQWSDGNTPHLILDSKGNVVKDWATLPPLTLELWALEGHTLKFFNSLQQQHKLQLELPQLSDTYIKASHRSFSSQFLKEYSSITIDTEAFCPHWHYPLSNNEEQKRKLQNSLHFFEQAGCPTLLLKRAFTSSGRGLQTLQLPLSEDELTQLSQKVQRYQGLSLEPKLNKLQDWAIEYHINALGEVTFVALSKFQTNGWGAYQGNIITNQEKLWAELQANLTHKLEDIISQHQAFLSQALAGHYIGYIGIDMLLYQKTNGSIGLQACIEINIRSTMGLVAHLVYDKLSQEKQISPEKNYLYCVDFLRTDWEQYRQSLGSEPILLSGIPQKGNFIAYVIEVATT